MDQPTREEPRWRRLHRTTGGIVLGLFLVEHLLTNASAVRGAASFEAVVGAVERSRTLWIFEVAIWIAIGIHVGYGIRIARQPAGEDAGRYSVVHDQRIGVFQRISAVLLLLFLVGHVGTLTFPKWFLGLAPETFHTVLARQLSSTAGGVPWVALLYLVGIAIAALHFANGLFAATAAWGIGSARRRLVRGLTILLGALLFLLGSATVLTYATGTRLLPPPDADSGPCGSAAAAPAPSR